MSEVRRVKVDLKDFESIKEACDEIGIEIERVREDSYLLKNHGVQTYANSPVYLDKIGDSFSVRADDYGQGLVNLTKKIKSSYNQKVIKKAAKSLGYSIVNETSRNGKKVLRLRTFR